MIPSNLTQIGHILIARNETLATAESCTGGLIAKGLTDMPGSSSYFVEGVVTYANESKIRRLGVPETLLASVGAVSLEVAGAMATGCRHQAGVAHAIATTGIAGPGGGTPQKPVGLVFIAYAGFGDPTIHELRLDATLGRNGIRQAATEAALNLLLSELNTLG